MSSISRLVLLTGLNRSLRWHSAYQAITKQRCIHQNADVGRSSLHNTNASNAVREPAQTDAASATKSPESSTQSSKPDLRRGRWSPKEIAELKRLREEGHTIAQIATELNRSYYSVEGTISRYALARMYSSLWTQAEMRQLFDLVATGLGADEIAKRLKRRVANVAMMIKGMRADQRAVERVRDTSSWSPQEFRDVRKYWDMGLATKEIARRLDRPAATVKHICGHYNLHLDLGPGSLVH